MKSNFTPSGFIRQARLHQRADRLEDNLELLVILFLQRGELARKVRIRCEHLPELNKGPHDGDVDLHRARAAENAGEHGNALFGEGVGAVAITPPAGGCGHRL